MVYTATNLITDAYYLSGVVSREFETPTGDQITDGLNLLNDFLAVKTADFSLIPYATVYDMTLVQGQELYFIPNLIHIDTFTFYINNVRFGTSEVLQKDYFGSARVEGIPSLPFNWNQQRTTGGTNLRLYFEPQSNYNAEITGKFGLTQVTSLTQDLSILDDRYYLVYLRYGLAEYICESNNVVLQPQTAQKLKEIEAMILDITPKDLSLNKISSFQSQGGLTWADINLGKGWRPN